MNNQKSLLVSMGFALMLLTCGESANANKALNHDQLNAIPVGQTSFTPITTTEEIVICLTDVCRPTNNTDSSTISVNDLAHLVEQDLNQALNNLAAAERGEFNFDENAISQDLTDNPRRIVRRSSYASHETAS